MIDYPVSAGAARTMQSAQIVRALRANGVPHKIRFEPRFSCERYTYTRVTILIDYNDRDAYFAARGTVPKVPLTPREIEACKWIWV